MAPQRLASERLIRSLLGASALLSGAAVLAVLAFLAILSAPVLTGATDIWTWDWRPFQGHHGILPMVLGSFLVATGALALAFPAGVLIAAFAHGLGPRGPGGVVMAIVRLMTGVPTIVYAFVSAIVLAPMVRRLFEEGTGYCLLTTALVLSVLVLPTIVLLLHAQWQTMGDRLHVTCAALGLTRGQAVLHVLIPLSRRGLLVAGIFGLARAVGDTMIALLLSGNAAQVPASPLDSLRTLTAHIALVHSTDSQDATYASIFAAGLLLLCTTATLSVAARAMARGEDAEEAHETPR